MYINDWKFLWLTSNFEYSFLLIFKAGNKANVLLSSLPSIQSGLRSLMDTFLLTEADPAPIKNHNHS